MFLFRIQASACKQKSESRIKISRFVRNTETLPPTNFKLPSLRALGVSEFFKIAHKVFCSSSRKKLLQSKTQVNYL